MGFMEIADKRFSCRKYEGRKVERKIIEKCIEAARIAPSAMNVQPWYFIIVDDPILRDSASKAAFIPIAGPVHFAQKAPVLIFMLRENPGILTKITGDLTKKNYSIIDTGIAAEHICLQAADEGLGTCMIGWFNEESVKKVLHLTKRDKIELIISMGYPVGKADVKNRKKLQEIMRYNNE